MISLDRDLVVQVESLKVLSEVKSLKCQGNQNLQLSCKIFRVHFGHVDDGVTGARLPCEQLFWQVGGCY